VINTEYTFIALWLSFVVLARKNVIQSVARFSHDNCDALIIEQNSRSKAGVQYKLRLVCFDRYNLVGLFMKTTKN